MKYNIYQRYLNLIEYLELSSLREFDKSSPSNFFNLVNLNKANGIFDALSLNLSFQ